MNHWNFLRVALLTGAVFSAGAAIAAGNEGDGKQRGEPLEKLIATEVIEASPKFDDTPPSGTARAAMPATLPMLGTVSRSAASDDVASTPPSAEIGAAFRAGIPARPRTEGKSAEPDPALKERTVFGDDTRVNIVETDRHPFRMFGFIRIEKQDGKISGCSGTLIGPRTVLTAAHCLYDHENGWRKNFIFVPGMKDMRTAPFGAFEYETASIMQGYIDNYQGYYGSVVDWDIGIITLKKPAGDTAGWMSITHDPELTGFAANIIGYPGDKPGGTMWRAACDVETAAIGWLTFSYQCDTYPGSSGSAVYDYDRATKSRTILGVNVAENPIANTAVRLNATYFEWVRGLIK